MPEKANVSLTIKTKLQEYETEIKQLEWSAYSFKVHIATSNFMFGLKKKKNFERDSLLVRRFWMARNCFGSTDTIYNW